MKSSVLSCLSVLMFGGCLDFAPNHFSASASDTCRDGEIGSGESDVDCGGPCASCADGRACNGDGDCQSTSCVNGVCLNASCADGARDGGETDIDCGGPCARCGEGKGCTFGTDCASAACEVGVCVEPRCSDNVRNGSETDVDCGGAQCEPCGAGKGCALTSDCADDLCQGLVCIAASCSDGLKNGTEADIDCGASCPSACGDNKQCQHNDDCASGFCGGGRCVGAQCGNGGLDAGETDNDCGGPFCPHCARGKHCNEDTDCVSASCVSGICASCPTATQNIVRRVVATGVVKTAYTDSIEVTNEAYAEWLATTPSTAGQTGLCNGRGFTPHSWYPSIVPPPGLDCHPVTSIEWCGAQAYCKAHNQTLCGRSFTGAAIDYGVSGGGYGNAALDTWYDACTNNNQYAYSYATTADAARCNVKPTSGSPAGAPENVNARPTCRTNDPVEFTNMLGNVAEWSAACSGNYCRARGGHYDTTASTATCAYNVSRITTEYENWIGFRCCRYTSTADAR